MPLLAASFESLIVFVVILLLSALGNWLKTRKAQGTGGWEDEEHPAPPLLRRDHPEPGTPPPPAQPPPAFDLERELRRLFGEEPEPKPLPPPLRPKPVTAAEPRQVFVPASTPHDAPTAESGTGLDTLPAPDFELATLEESASAYLRGSTIDHTAHAKLEAAKARTERPGAGPSGDRRRAQSTDVTAVRALLRHPATARQAILASVILSPPKGLSS